MVRPRHRIPVSAVTTACLVVSRPGGPVLPTGRARPLRENLRVLRRLDTSHVKSSRDEIK
ncbi:hypothetical protein GFS60_03527 [Rhodococcus sp. WAY2]|nr:hypothetical protein GFS60_03527 [Rhodococcus sp. WAY2]